MAQQEYKQNESVGLLTQLMNKDDKTIVASTIKEVTTELGFPFAGMWQIDPSKSSNKLAEYMIKKYGKDKALEKAKSMGFKSIEESVEFHFNETISFTPGTPIIEQTVYRTSDGKDFSIYAPEGQVSSVSQPGPLKNPIYTKALVGSNTTTAYLMVIYYSDAAGEKQLGYDQRVIQLNNTNVMTETFVFQGDSSSGSTKVFNRVTTIQDLIAFQKK